MIAALAAAVANQGAYYGAGQWPVVLLLGAAVVAGLRARPWSRADSRVPPLALCAALAGWALVRGALAGDMTAALPVAALLAAAVAVVATARRTASPELLAAAVVAIGALVALTGWIGVAWRISPWALEDQRLWRAATSLTYANAAAGLLGALALFALGRLVGRQASAALERAGLCLLLVGLGATLSRGGLFAAAVGLAVLVGMRGARPVARAGTAPFGGAVIALAGLLPSMPAGSPSRPGVALLSLAAGLAVAAGLGRVSVSRRRPAATALLVGAAVLVLAVGASQAVSAVGRTRFTLASPDRQEAAEAGMRLVAENPLAGVGPGQAVLRWEAPDGRTFVAKYAHNEYLQILVELGAVGLALVLAVFLLTARRVRSGRRAAPVPSLRAGAVAGLLALLVGSSFDFLWHVPAVPLFAALLVAFTVPNTERKHI
ncbi:MAG TPA: O-antigen ligase family protein [Acidimicrobiales bacterium]|nr:O-antigen ligase family protein [Acidimicrobiales bacterium]